MPHDWKHLLDRPLWQLILLLLICTGAFFPHLGGRPAELMEARNFVTAREIVQNDTWLVPTLNGLPRIAKPPLPTWLTAITYILGGQADDNGLLRLPAAIMGVILIFALWGVTRCLWGNNHLALTTATVGATSFLIMEMSRNGSWDIYCHSFMLLAIWALAYGWQKDSAAYLPMLLAGILMACSFLSKGPVAFFSLLLPFCIAYGSAMGARGIIRQIKPLLVAILIATVISSIWPLLIYFKMPQLSSTVATTEAASWMVRHRRPFYFYAHFPVYAGLWTLVVAVAIFFPFARRRIDQVGKYRFIILWGFISLVLLSIVPEKKERYLLPAMIPFSLLAGHLVYSVMAAWVKGALSKKDWRLIFLQTGLTMAVGAAAPVLLFFYGVKSNLVSVPGAVGWSIIFCAAGGICAYAYKKRFVPGIFGMGVIIVLMVNLALLPTLFLTLKLMYKPGVITLRESRQVESIRDLPFFSIRDLNPKFIWNAGKMIRTWDIAKAPDPAGGKPFVLLSLEGFSNGLHRRYAATPVGKYHYDPTNLKKYIYLTMITLKDDGNKRTRQPLPK